MIASEDFWDDIFGHLKDRVLVPVVGPEAVTVSNDGRQIPLYRLLGEQFAKKYDLTFDDAPPDLSDALNQYLARRADAERLYRVVNDLLTGINPPVPDNLRRLASIDDFPLFIGTTFDGLLTRAVNDVRFGGQPRTRDLWFSPNQSTIEQQDNARVPRDDESVVFRLFGKAASRPVYALHEEDVLEWLHALLTETARLPDWLQYRLKESPLLFLGCQLSDWVGRLLTRMTSSQRLSLASKQFFIVGQSVAQYPGLVAFFKTFTTGSQIQMVQADPAAFIAELHQRWRDRNPVAPRPDHEANRGTSTESKGNIFISYVREDADAVRRLSDAITGIGGDVWLDERRLLPGDSWESEILNSIRRDIRLFLPIISMQTESREEGYIFKEWREAAERARSMPPGGRRFIVPVVIDSDYDGNPSRYRQVPDAFAGPHWGHAPDGRPDDKLIVALKDALRDSRRREAV